MTQEYAAALQEYQLAAAQHNRDPRNLDALIRYRMTVTALQQLILADEEMGQCMAY